MNGSALPPRSTLRMIPPSEALRLVLETVRPLPPRSLPVDRACGFVVAESLVAVGEHPPFARSMMDGYAVRVASAGRSVKISGEIPAGSEAEHTVTEDLCAEILTGARCPRAAEAVVQKEHARREGDSVRLPRHILPGQHIAPPGSDCRSGEVLLRSGEILRSMAVGALSACGIESVRVVPRPRAAVVTTGSEVVAPGGEPGPAKIRDSNGPMLLAALARAGIEVENLLHAGDSVAEILERLERVADRDLILVTGGVSAGSHDRVPEALERWGAEIVFRRVAQKPGKPLVLARKGERILFGLSGNPLACHLGFHLYVAAGIRVMEGRPGPEPPLEAILEEAVRQKPGRTHFVPAAARWCGEGAGRWFVRPLAGASSADIFRACSADAYVEVRPGEATLEAGERVTFRRID